MSVNVKKSIRQAPSSTVEPNKSIMYKTIHKKTFPSKQQDSKEDLLVQINELKEENAMKQKVINELKIKNDQFKKRLDKLQHINTDLIKFISQLNEANIKNMQEKIIKLTEENNDLTMLLEEISISQDKTKAENKLIKKLLTNYKRKSGLSKDNEQDINMKCSESNTLI